MFKSKTLFVVGAGASQEAGLPTGTELKSIIAEKLDITFDHGNPLLSEIRGCSDCEGDSGACPPL